MLQSTMSSYVRYLTTPKAARSTSSALIWLATISMTYDMCFDVGLHLRQCLVQKKNTLAKLRHQQSVYLHMLVTESGNIVLLRPCDNCIERPIQSTACAISHYIILISNSCSPVITTRNFPIYTPQPNVNQYVLQFFYSPLTQP